MDNINKEIENKFNSSQIYMIYSESGPLVYIGSIYSTKYISNRMGAHRCKYRLYLNNKHNYVTSFKLFDTYGLENCKIKLIEKFPCNNRKELLEREGYWIKHYLLNGHCVNKIIAGRKASEYYKDTHYKSQREYYKKNYDILKEKRKNKYIERKNKTDH